MSENIEAPKKPELYYFVSDHIAFIVLDRPQSLNALSAEAILLLFNIFKRLEDDANISYIVIKSSSPNFSSGGDIKAAYHQYLEQRQFQLASFFKIEYALINKIASSKKAISLVSGIAYGAGLALALSCKYSFFSSQSTSAAPEIKIAFYPDAGLSYWLNAGDKKFPGFALYFALRGEVMQACDLETAGLISGVIDHDDLSMICEHLIEEQPHTHQNLTKIFKPFLHPTVLKGAHELREKLRPYSQVLGIEDVEHVSHFPTSPLSLWATYHHIHKTKGKSLRDVLSLDLTLSNIFINTDDFFEGIRTIIINKKSRPAFREPLTCEIKSRISNIYSEQTQ